MSREFGHIIAGGGLSGLLLARGLCRWGRDSILIVDPDLGGGGHRTLAYWNRGRTVLDPWSIGCWRQLAVGFAEGRRRRLDLGGGHYRAVDWRRARADLLADLRNDPRVTLLEARADEVHDGLALAEVRTEGVTHRARWVYDSRSFDTLSELAGTSGGRVVEQAFSGVWVETAAAIPDPGTATLMDFGIATGPHLEFSYILPADSHSALVMGVRMGAGTAPPDPVAVAHDHFGGDLDVVGEERGRTLLASPFPSRRQGHRVLRIGRRGGRVRPSTGYAVTRILRDTSAICASLRRAGHPFDLPRDSRRDELLDAIWLGALLRQGSSMEPAFEALFSKVPPAAVLAFLNGEAHRGDLARIVRALPPGPFLGSASRLAAERLIPGSGDPAWGRARSSGQAGAGADSMRP